MDFQNFTLGNILKFLKTTDVNPISNDMNKFVDPIVPPPTQFSSNDSHSILSLIDNPRADSSQHHDFVLKYHVQPGNTQIISSLLRDQKIGPFKYSDYCLKIVDSSKYCYKMKE